MTNINASSSSLLDIQISDVSKVLIPTRQNVSPGYYSSKIVDITVAIQHGEEVGIDFTHEIRNQEGMFLMVRFRYYAPHELNELLAIFAGYGLKGSLTKEVLGLEEEICVSYRKNGEYLFISERNLTTSQTPTTSINQKPSVQESEQERTNSPYKHRRNVLTSKRASSTQSKPNNFSLLDDDDDDDFAIFDDEE